jgi:hypothetical protein
MALIIMKETSNYLLHAFGKLKKISGGKSQGNKSRVKEKRFVSFQTFAVVHILSGIKKRRVVMAVNTKLMFWDVTQCSMVYRYLLPPSSVQEYQSR